MNKKSPHLSLVQALSWIVGSVFVCALVFHKSLVYYQDGKKGKHVPARIEYLVQSGSYPYQEPLRSDYIMEMLDLSIDNPLGFSSFQPKKATQVLASSPLLQEVQVKKIAPNMVYVDYTRRRPMVQVIDFVNIAADREGVLFPIHPFFSPKKLTEVYLGEKGRKTSPVSHWGDRIQGPYQKLAWEVCDFLWQEGEGIFFVKRVDVSEAFAASLGRREIVVQIERELLVESSSVVVVHLLRLDVKGFREGIEKYRQLQEHLWNAVQQEVALLGDKGRVEKVVDLRINSFAYIK